MAQLFWTCLEQEVTCSCEPVWDVDNPNRTEGWYRVDSNHQRQALQACALPLELRHRVIGCLVRQLPSHVWTMTDLKLAVGEGFKPPCPPAHGRRFAHCKLPNNFALPTRPCSANRVSVDYRNRTCLYAFSGHR
jgi:hypothetical protein